MTVRGTPLSQRYHGLALAGAPHAGDKGIMKRIFLALLCVGWLAPDLALAGSAEKRSAESLASEERILGAADDEARFQAMLPFTREIALTGRVGDSLDGAMTEVGVPSVVRLEVRQALGGALDVEHEVVSGDRFRLRYEQSFDGQGTRLGVGRLTWVELRTRDKGTVGVHRFHASAHGETLWLTTGQAAAPAVMRLPLDTIAISSRFGMRADPFEQLKPATAQGGPVATHATGRAATINVATKRGMLAGLAPSPMASRSIGRASAVWYMHEGIDLVAPVGTPIYAAGDGVISGAGPNGGYGNWVRIEHPGRFATVYGHLQNLAPDMEVGRAVMRGELIGFVGSTGHSTGAHLHFELLSNGKPVDPLGHPNFKPVRLEGGDLERFRRQVSRSRPWSDQDAGPAAPVPAASGSGAREGGKIR